MQNSQLVEYKLKKLNRPALVLQLRDALYEHKVMGLKSYEEFDMQRGSAMEEQIAALQEDVMELQRNLEDAAKNSRAHDIPSARGPPSGRDQARQTVKI